jgi:hypothetical protein
MVQKPNRKYIDMRLLAHQAATTAHATPAGGEAQALPFTEWLRSKGKVGGQHKVPRLSNERQYVEEIKALVHVG